MTARARRLAVSIAVAAAATAVSQACTSLRPSAFRSSEPQRAWPQTLDDALARAAAGHPDEADSTLAVFAERYTGTQAALETAYWRAVFKMDPANPHASVPAALSSLDAYLADPRPHSHLAEATTLRRIAGNLDGMTRTMTSAVNAAKDANASVVNARAQVVDANARADAAKADPAADAEVKRLKEELAKANAELERIRKRLSQNPAKPPAR